MKINKFLQTKRKNKTTSLLLMLAMLLTLMPLTALAAVTSGTLWIGGVNKGSLTGAIPAETGWSWDESTATLTLNGYNGGQVRFAGVSAGDMVNLAYIGNITVNNVAGHAIELNNGTLVISGGGGTMTLQSSARGILSPGALIINSGTIAISANWGIEADGNITISGSSNVTATATGGFGIISNGGNITISTSGTVNATAELAPAIGASGTITVSGTANVKAARGGGAAMTASNINVTGGTLVAEKVGGFDADILGSLSVSGAGTIVTVNGNLAVPGNLTVSGGTVTVTGIVSGTQTLTGGTVTIAGTQVYPPTPGAPLFDGLADQYTAGSPAVTLKVTGTGSEQLTVLKVNGATATAFNPVAAGTYLIEATSADGRLKIWKYVRVN